ncbi:MAG: hypothetical protein HGJ94_19980 [Desulfosarcina sp.]|nr:hypothetical protein [Desulfosarcina sp.]MBC2745031.1 hypothetical protein [Desulfosarcina sp.]MBC2767939.1 hypothetical protein [Desulfosarcina sp.]
MPDATILFNITPVPSLSVLVWILLSIAAMYFARRPFHDSMASLSRVIYNAMRVAAASVKMTQRRLEERNREVLLATGMEHAERRAEREFERISTMVERNLEAYPQLQRQIRENLLKLEDDYQKTAEIPLGLSDWVKVIDAIAGIKPSGDPMVANLLEDIHNTLKEQHKAAIEGHRKAVSDRHGILSRMVPQWRATDKTLKGLEKTISNLTGRSRAVDQCMTDYETVRTHTDMAERQLSSSSLTQFFTSGLVLGVFVIGAIINFNLVALPMSEMVGGASYIGTFKTSDVAGIFIVCLEVVVGIFLMDALRFTRLFSVIGCLDDKKRTWFFWILLAMLTILAGVESSLAFMRDRIAADMEALRQSLAGIESSAVAASKIPTIGQMILGFILPFILTTVAMPFESFISSSRTVLGMAGAWALRALAFLLRLAGNLGYYLGRVVVNVYDLVIFPALWLEALILRKMAAAPSAQKAEKNRPAAQKKSMTMLEETAPCKKTAD